MAQARVQPQISAMRRFSTRKRRAAHSLEYGEASEIEEEKGGKRPLLAV
jgi:hypothetical protein